MPMEPVYSNEGGENKYKTSKRMIEVRIILGFVPSSLFLDSRSGRDPYGARSRAVRIGCRIGRIRLIARLQIPPGFIFAFVSMLDFTRLHLFLTSKSFIYILRIVSTKIWWTSNSQCGEWRRHGYRGRRRHRYEGDE